MKTLLWIFVIVLVSSAWYDIHTRVVDEGNVSVIVTQINHEGLFVKTWEIQTSSGGYHDFTVEDPNLLKVIQNCGERTITLHYVTLLWTPLRSSNGGRFVTSVKVEK